MNKIKLSGIYPISPNYINSDDEYLEKCFIAITSGINIFQFRSPFISSRKKRYLLNEIYKYCLNYNVQLVINNDYSIARSYEGAGVHVGKKDLSIKSIKNIIGSETLIGYSCGSEVMNLRHLRENGISYYSIGALFKSSTKTNIERLSTDTIKKYKSCNDLPMCIIGGLNINNIDSVIEYQPDMIAISNGIFGQEKDKIQDSIKMFQEKMNAKN
jgi:thiamine-phosphate pyrophosphorylase